MSTLPQPKPRRKNRGRGAGEGTIYHRVEVRTYRRKDGSIGESVIDRWLADVDLGIVNGKRRRQHIAGATREEVARKLTTTLHERDHGRRPDVDPARTTVGEWLDAWLEDVVKRTRRPNTYLLYGDSLRKHIAPALGSKRLGALRRKDIDEWIRDLERTDLAPRTIHRLWAVLHSGLQHAVRTERLAANPASQPSLPRVEKQEPRALPREHVLRLLEAIQGEPDAALYALELATGLREGELLGLQWAKDDRAPGVDLKRAEIRVYEQLHMASSPHSSVAPRDGCCACRPHSWISCGGTTRCWIACS